jgi:hypothetical protein
MSVLSNIAGRFEAGKFLFLFALALVLLPGYLRAQSPLPSAAQDGATTLAQFRQLISSPRMNAEASKKKSSTSSLVLDYQAVDEAFLQVLLIQARVSAARQSLDRLAGWNKAIQPRIENQSIPPIDVEILAVAEKKAASEVARQESDLRRAAAMANSLVARETSLPLVAIVDAPAADSWDGHGLSTMEKEVLTHSRDLLVKLFQSYSLGGIEVTELLWYEQEAAQAESAYRLWAARAGFDAAKRAAEYAH